MAPLSKSSQIIWQHRQRVGNIEGLSIYSVSGHHSDSPRAQERSQQSSGLSISVSIQAPQTQRECPHMEVY